ncbi:hypothetical protein GUITHDRAFT_120811 [Guillardia theta CCMP2712]|uniref:Uncharacterized protein n=1 Tax=Guillardia theta (strain CCMP2712) TaxID=905079 RepID=L1IAV8_GUITC|nr:hypothetical protein GUITHDRAFT_120811 [Guillardia theta CCMP2712]EKX32980.1 hypothetical protein GUITHDRAFT_120811 [Guillardia theta CCMP2712]|eukprot:XP_005819960.1 hypothetical protein GUITHDRAFT_120811 [Guillardia theta CCMP2712]
MSYDRASESRSPPQPRSRISRSGSVSSIAVEAAGAIDKPDHIARSRAFMAQSKSESNVFERTSSGRRSEDYVKKMEERSMKALEMISSKGIARTSSTSSRRMSTSDSTYGSIAEYESWSKSRRPSASTTTISSSSSSSSSTTTFSNKSRSGIKRRDSLKDISRGSMHVSSKGLIPEHCHAQPMYLNLRR